MRIRGQQIAVITYTNAACDEIKRRLDFDPLINVSTIHSFVWTLIEGFNSDIRSWLKASISEEIIQIKEEQKKGKPGTKTAVERERRIESLQRRLALLPTIKKFVYSPTGENRTRDSLNHAEVIKIGASFLTAKPLMQELLVSKYPVLLIDESQDTNKLLMEAFFVVQGAQSERFCMGLFGDTMQRIYSDGKIDLGRNLPTSWKRPAKVMNHRCPVRVVNLINKIRSAVDDQKQKHRSDAPAGFARLFITSSARTDKQSLEALVRRKMAETTGDSEWEAQGKVKTLILEHLMAAKRLGFLEMFESLYEVDEFKTGLRDGTLPAAKFFADLVLPLVNAQLENNRFATGRIVRTHSPLLAAESFHEVGANQIEKITVAKEAVRKLGVLFSDGKRPKFIEVLASISDTGLFEIPESLQPFVGVEEPVITKETEEAAKADQPISRNFEAIRKFLNSEFSQITAYASYVKGTSEFATHQGVKGLEFPRVLVIMDDEEAGGFLFSYEKLFTVKAKTDSDRKNESEGKETSIDRTRRLFYVTCSRTEESLGIIAYSVDPTKVRDCAIREGWFEAAEIEIV